uniref:NADH-ubiquinone oxidoreductase chain 4L n=1 Tax=Brachyuropus grewingkii TaxID=686699 RepID=A0A0U1YUM9_9CRUS|nr:NADH dehydrogenase subunit 4L [Brachyuropus grewingkii]AJF22809.1 NADH dehydrogenase subunit 4L [Brachyuropus grewingkii]
MMFYVEGSIGLGLIVGSLSFVLNYGHLLNSLLSLEFLTLMIYWLLGISSGQTGKDIFFLLFYLVMVVCEGVLGLSVLISSVYSHGLDYMKNYNSLSC